MSSKQVWRLGHASGPCDFIPHHLSSWNHRFDDPKREYRTIYCADKRVTCLKEVLADLRPNKKRIQDFEEIFGSLTEELPKPGFVSMLWRKDHVLVQAAIVISNGSIIYIEDKSVQKHIETDLAYFLKLHNITKLNKSVLQGKNRDITRKISRFFFEGDGAGIQFHSRLDENICAVLFEGKAFLKAASEPISMIKDDPDLLEVCKEYSLTLQGS